MPKVNPQQTPGDITRRHSTSVTTFSSQELANASRKKMLKLVTTALLSTLALGVGIAGIALTITLGSPIFLSLLLTSVLFAGIALLAHKALTKKADGKWEELLEQDFRPLPAQTVLANFVITPGSHLSFFQNKINPKVKIGLQETISPAFQLQLQALPKSNTPKGIAQPRTMMFNAVANDQEGRIVPTTNQGLGFFKSFVEAHRINEWHLSQYAENSLVPLPFEPTEARANAITLKDTMPSASRKATCPDFLGHVLGPKIDDFSGDDQTVMNHYYDRALYAYEHSLETAIKHHCTLVSLPLFSSVYEVNTEQGSPEPNRSYVWDLNCKHLCKKALLDALNNTVLRHDRSLRLTVLLQDPFSCD